MNIYSKGPLILRTLIALIFAFGLAAAQAAVVFTNDTLISSFDTNYDNADVLITNCTLTVDGPHVLSSLLVAQGGVLTHTFSANGTLSVSRSFVDEAQILIGTNPVTLLNSGTITTQSVTDVGHTIIYTNGLDYSVTLPAPDVTQLQRTTNSSIPDGATVLVSYTVLVLTPAGLSLTVTGNLTVATDGAINVNARGMGGGLGTGHGNTATSNPSDGSGAGYGGFGGMSSSNAVGGATYGLLDQPANLGSGGGAGAGGSSAPGGSGGGAIKLSVGGTAAINGIISADGADATNSRAGGGSGGSIWLTAASVTGTGTLSANGGAGEPVHGGGGGGGRIAILCDSNTFTGVSTACGASGWKTAGAGTIYTKLTTQPGLVLVDNGGRNGTNTTLTPVTGADVLIRGNANAFASSSWTIRNLTIASNSLLLVPAFNAPHLTVTGSMNVQSNGGFIADGAGSSAGSGSGPGGSYNDNNLRPCGGGGYGGFGASGSNPNARGGSTYGVQGSPTSLGSGGASLLGSSISSTGGPGGGVLWLNVTGSLQVQGRVSANGANGSGSGGGGGSGGSVYLTVGSLSGSGVISANGGNGAGSIGGGGGGGRIAIYPSANSFSGVLSASGGGGANWGGAGTILFQSGNQNPQLILDNASHAGTNTPFQSVSSSTDLILRNGVSAVQSSSSMTFSSLFIGSNSWLRANPQLPQSSVSLTVLGNATFQSGAGILTDASGYGPAQGIGPGGSSGYPPSNGGGGAGHGGYGANGVTNLARGGTAYGSTATPTTLGSGGGSSYEGTGGAGGGSIRLVVNGALQLDGRISANGASGLLSGGGGAGGSAWLTLGSLTGTGAITADGGSGADSAGGGGGGGRISITYSTNSFAGTISAFGGFGPVTNWGGAGTVYIKTNNQQLAKLILNNAGHVGTNTFFDPINLDAAISGGAIGQMPVSNWSLRHLLVQSNSALVSYSSPAGGGGLSTVTASGNTTIETGGAISGDGLGYTYGSGPGSGSSISSTLKGGAGHGGYGAANPNNAGGVYDSIIFPTQPGSGGGGSGSSFAPFGGAGGAALRLNITGTLTVNGRLSANGKNGDVGAGGGSGGALWITAGTLAGSGPISANGGQGNGSAGGGGGGRISIGYGSSSFSGALSAYGGNGLLAGGAGTIYTKANSVSVGQLLIDNGGLPGTNTPLSSAYAIPTLPFNLSIVGGASVYPATPLPLLSNLTVGASSVLTTLASQSNLVLAVLQNVNLLPGGVISVSGKGFARTNGPGAGASLASKGSGGGYGGAGGASSSGAAGGAAYGSMTHPVDRGSGGGAGANTFFGGSDGGGAIRLSVGGALIVNGTLSADGSAGLQDDSGGGAGGSIWIAASALSGAGSLSVSGGPGELYGGGGGAGGRLAIYSPANTFTGLVSVAGGEGAAPGQSGTLFVQTNLDPFQITSHSPVGVVSNTVSFVDLNFNEMVSPGSVSVSAFALFTPSGSLAQSNLTASATGLSAVRVSFPPQNAPGNYRFEAGPGLVASILGQPISQVYTGAFAVDLPTISGLVTDTNGLPVAGVLLQPNGGLGGATTDAAGNYAVGVPPGWNGNVSPSLGSFMFVPGSLSYTNVTASVTNQNYLMVQTISPLLSANVSGTNIALNWLGMAGVSYQASWSTNLVNWQPFGPLLPGTNAFMQLVVPLNALPAQFFRLQATD